MDVKKISEKFPNIWKLNNTLLKSSLIKEEIREIRNYFELNENENTIHQILWGTIKSNTYREIYNTKCLYKKGSQLNDLIFHFK